MSADHIDGYWVFTIPIVQKASEVDVDQDVKKMLSEAFVIPGQTLHP